MAAEKSEGTLGRLAGIFGGVVGLAMGVGEECDNKDDAPEKDKDASKKED